MRRRRGRQRALDQARLTGREIATARRASGMSASMAATRAGVSRSTWMRAESGSPRTAIATLCAVTDAVGLDLVLRVYPGTRPTLRDRGQLSIAQHLAGLARSAWTASLEQPAGDHGQAIDLVLSAATEIVGVEIIRHMNDYQAQYRSAVLKRDWLGRLHPRPIRLVMAVEDLRSNRAALAPYAAILESALPAGSRRVLDSFRTGQPLGTDGLLWVRRHPSPIYEAVTHIAAPSRAPLTDR